MNRIDPKNLFKKNLNQKKWGKEIDPDEIFLDSTNLPDFDQSQFEGRLEKPITKRTIYSLAILFIFIFLLFGWKVFKLQIVEGEKYAERSLKNNLKQMVIFADRGVIYDRNKVLMASNIYSSTTTDFSKRVYADVRGMAHVLGYIRYPAKDSKGFYYFDHHEGVDGVEKVYDEALAGKTGLKIYETNALGQIESESVLEPPQDGATLNLAIDSRISEELYDLMKTSAENIGFQGGAGVIMDVETGEILTSVSYPEYNSNVMTERKNAKEINRLFQSKQTPFLDRVTEGLYTPGSIVKPFVAIAALKEGIISPEKQILSTGSISIPNPFDPEKKSVFNDWRPQGLVDMRQALAVSSDVYFYEIGGGFESQQGLGIESIEKYMKMFGFGPSASNNPLLKKSGSIPSPQWKKENFDGDVWRIGDTYHTSIGQYGFQVTPMQVVRAVASIANGGRLLEPSLLVASKSEAESKQIVLPFSDEEIKVIKEGMKEAVMTGTAKGLNIPQVTIGAKTGTAELGSSKKLVNSWIVGFFPYEKPKYAFATIMEKGPYENTIGALYVMRQLFEWMSVNTPEYFKVAEN